MNIFTRIGIWLIIGTMCYVISYTVITFIQDTVLTSPIEWTEE